MEIAGLTLGVREGVIGLIAFVALYMLVVLLRMRRLRNKLPVAVPPTMAAEPPVIPMPPATAAMSVPETEQEPALPAAPDIPWNEPPERAPSASVAPALAREVAQLRDEVDALRGELAALRDDMLHELAHMRAAQTVSPIYGDAMQMAVSGYEPAVIAERCGIARAEAELVVALAKSQEQ